MRHYNIIVEGKVQGVWFRRLAAKEALKLGIHGFIQNRINGTVYIEAEGSREQLTKLLQWCERGPTEADVLRVITDVGPVKNFGNFRVKKSE